MLTWYFDFTFPYIVNVLSQNNSRFGDYVDRFYPIEHEAKDTTNTAMYVSYIDLTEAVMMWLTVSERLFHR